MDAALHEIQRVLKPGGTFHFVEHGLAPDPDVQTWQRRLDPVQQQMFGGCHLTRAIADIVADSGLAIRDVDEYYETSVPRFIGALTLGVATTPPSP